MSGRKGATQSQVKRGRPPAHPGEILREDVLPDIDMTRTALARALGISRNTLYLLLACKVDMTPNLAVRFGKLLGNGPELWLNLQQQYDLWHAARAVDLTKIPTLDVA